MKNYIKFLLYGILFVGIQEFWVTVLWGIRDGGSFESLIGNFILAIIVTEFTFLSLVYYISKKIDFRFSKSRVSKILLYILSGFLGLIFIEWILVGKVPGTDNSQLVMFSTWGGCTLFAKILLDQNNNILRLKKYMFRFFIIFTGLATFLSIILLYINPQLSFSITYIAAIIGYPLMNIFYIWYFLKKTL